MPVNTPPLGWWFRAAYALWLFGIVAYFIPPATWSPASRFAVTSAIVEHGELYIDRHADSTGDRALVNGHWYSDKAPVVALLAVPPYAVYHLVDRARGTEPRFTALATADTPAVRIVVNRSWQRGLYVCSLFTAGLCGSLVGVAMFELLRRRYSPVAALVGSALGFLATPVFPYATSLYGHSVAAGFLVLALAFIATDPDVLLPRAPWRWRAAGACFVLAAGAEYIVAGPALVIGAVLVLMQPKDARGSALQQLAIGAALPVVAIGTYHTLCFGAPWRTGYSFVVSPKFAAGHESGFLGVHAPRFDVVVELLFGKRRGLFYVAPVAAVAAALLVWSALKQREHAVRASALAFVTLLLLNAGYYMWWGGAAAAPRHLVPVLGFLGFGAAAAWSRPRWRWVVLALGFISAANMVVVAGVGVEAPEEGDVLLGYAYRRMLLGQLGGLSGSNLGIEIGLPRAASLGPVIAWIVVGLRFLVRQLQASSAQGEAPGALQPAVSGKLD
jgi:hypothetical protein